MAEESVEKTNISKEEKALVKGLAEAADVFQASDEYEQIKKNFDYFEGAMKIERSMRGGYKRFATGDLASTKSPDRSPKSANDLWRAPAQKDDETWMEFTRRRLVYVNYSKLIIQERGSILYKTPPVREWGGASGLQNRMQEIYSDPDNSSKGKFISFHRNAITGGTTAVIPYPDFETKRIILRGYSRKSFHAVFDPYNGDMIGFIIFGSRYNWKSRKTEPFYQVWTTEGVYDLDKQKKIQKAYEHFCGEIPVCLFRENNDDLAEIHFGSVTASDLVNNNEDINVKLSDLAFAGETQAFSVLYTQNVDDVVRTGARGRINAQNVTAEYPVEAKYLNPGAQIGELQEMLTAGIEQLFLVGRIPKGVIMPDDTSTSGVHLKIQWFPVQRIFEESKVAYIDNERRLSYTIALVDARWMAKSFSAAVPEVELDVDFSEKNVMPQDDETKLQADEWDLQHGLKSPVDILMERNPDLDEDEAVAEYERIKELNKRIGYTPSGGKTGTFQQPPRGRVAALEEIEGEEEEE